MAWYCVCACVYACVCVGARACVYVCNRACTYADSCDRARAYVRAYVHTRRVMNVITITIHTNRLDLGRATELNIEFRCASVVLGIVLNVYRVVPAWAHVCCVMYVVLDQHGLICGEFVWRIVHNQRQRSPHP